MELLISLLVPILGAAIIWVVAYIMKRFNVNLDTQIRILSIVKAAIDRTEHQAELYLREMGQKVDSKTKLAMALQMIDKTVEEYPEIKKYLVGKERELIEKMLKTNLVSESIKSDGEH